MARGQHTGDVAARKARTSSLPARRRSGVHTCMPFEPVTCANGVKPELAQQLAGMARGAAHGAELAAGGGVEVDHHPVGLPQAVRAREPHVRRDRVLAHEVDERVLRRGRSVCVTVPSAFGTSTRFIQSGK